MMRITPKSLAQLAASMALAATIAVCVPAETALAGSDDEELHEKKQPKLGDRHREFVFGVPNIPTVDWVLSSGGRLYDNWAAALEKEPPETTHPSWPTSNTKKKGGVTWRCKSCHGWDYKGAAGKYSSGSYKTGIAGVTHMHGTTPENMTGIIRDDIHRYTPDMISDEEATRIGLFIARGLHDTDAYIDRNSGSTNGSAARGARIFQNICASCHGFQGTKLDWGDDDEHAFVGTESNANPWEVLHKIRNGHPGHEMVSMRPFAMDVAVDILTYIRTLPEK